MPGKTRSEIENIRNSAREYVNKGAKDLGKAKSLEAVIDALLDIKEAVEEMNDKLDTIISNQ